MRAGVRFADPARIDLRGDGRRRPRRLDRRRRAARRRRRARRRRAHRPVLPRCSDVRARRRHRGARALRPRGAVADAAPARSARSRACGPAPSSPRTCTSATSSRPRRRRSAAAARPTTSPTSATPRSATSVNIGAGTITCNYDGVNKSTTTIDDGAFIGSDTPLVAPVTIGADATIGAGTTITQDAPAGELTVARARQTTIEGWKRPQEEVTSGSVDVDERKPRTGSLRRPVAPSTGSTIDTHRPPPSRLRQRDAPAVRFGDLARQRQAEAGAVALGRIERQQRVGQHRLVHAAAAIEHVDARSAGRGARAAHHVVAASRIRARSSAG